jgi:hypothetical protein
MSHDGEHRRIFHASIPLEFYLPGVVAEGIVREVLAGEYESGYDGTGLHVLDIGTNVGAFSVWAAHRWPGSTVDAYEHNPATFTLLERNTRRYPMIRCHRAAVIPPPATRRSFCSAAWATGRLVSWASCTARSTPMRCVWASGSRCG